MKEEDLKKLNEEKKSRIFHAVLIDFLAGISLFGGIAWVLNPDRQIGYLIAIVFPIYMILRVIKKSKKDKT